jgi:hypothetical protein
LGRGITIRKIKWTGNTRVKTKERKGMRNGRTGVREMFQREGEGGRKRDRKYDGMNN